MDTDVHLRLENEGKEIWHPKSAEHQKCMKFIKLEILTKTLKADGRVAVIQIMPMTTEGRDFFNEALFYQVLKDLDLKPNMNTQEPMPRLNQFITHDQLKGAKKHMLYLLSKALLTDSAVLYNYNGAWTSEEILRENN